ncbi:hypothetical protein LZ30DRAFT_743251 [Colletotrichum cereale]|nr:hypothetical protein LZ30DRAFT_743251 [Colletotrichum cereale]
MSMPGLRACNNVGFLSQCRESANHCHSGQQTSCCSVANVAAGCFSAMTSAAIRYLCLCTVTLTVDQTCSLGW